MRRKRRGAIVAVLSSEMSWEETQKPTLIFLFDSTQGSSCAESTGRSAVKHRRSLPRSFIFAFLCGGSNADGNQKTERESCRSGRKQDV